MRIVIDARNTHGSGIGRYVFKLVEHLQAVDTERDYVVLLGRRAFGEWSLEAPNFTAHLADQAIYSVGEQTSLLRTLRRLAPDLVHFTSFNAPVLYRGRRVTTVHDLTYLDFPSVRDSSPLGRARYRAKDLAMRAVLRTAVRRSHAVITDTRYVREQLLTHYGGAGLSPERAVAVHCGGGTPAPDPVDDGAPRRGAEAPYLLYVGHAYPHKNLRVLVDALRHVRSERPEVRLVLVGLPDSYYDELREHAADEAGVTFTGFVSDAELGALYRGAELFVLPSLSEGFGLPALEAMAHGTPVLCSNATCLPEVCGGAAEYFDPSDARALADKALALLSSEPERERLRAAGIARAGEFSWRRTAEETLAVYRRVLGEDGSRGYEAAALPDRLSV